MAGTRPRPRHTGGLEGEAARGRGGGQEGGTRSRQSGGKSGVLPARRFRQRFPCGGHRVGSISGAKWPVHSPPGSILCSSIGCVCCLSRRGWGFDLFLQFGVVHQGRPAPNHHSKPPSLKAGQTHCSEARKAHGHTSGTMLWKYPSNAWRFFYKKKLFLGPKIRSDTSLGFNVLFEP